MGSNLMSTAVYTGDCLDVLPTLPENSVDTVITDPPYGLGFMGKDWDRGVPGVRFWEEISRVAKPGAILLAFGGTRTVHRLTVAIEDAGWEIRDLIMWLYGSGFPKSHNISKAIDKAKGAEKVVGTIPDRWTGKGNSLNFATDRPQEKVKVTEPATPEAELWDGWGTALKPSWEPVIVAMNPLAGTFVENALENGVAGYHIDGARVPVNGESLTGGMVYKGRPKSSSGWDRPWMHDPDVTDRKKAEAAEKVAKAESLGRWPSNVIHDGSPEVMGLFPALGGASPSRFFYCAKASKKEKNAGLDGRSNTHPTVKPLALMRYLIRLTATPTGGTILDPFMGSGSTGVGCVLEGRPFIGIDKDGESVETANGRLEWAKKEAEKPKQGGLFGGVNVH